MKKKLVQVFLDPHGPGIFLGTWLCLLGGGYLAYSRGLRHGEWGWVWLFGVFALLRAFAWVRWYPAGQARAGIADHFDKVTVIAVWLTLLSALLAFLLGTAVVHYYTLMPLGVLLFWNFVLVVFHLQDRDPMAPNALSGSSRVF